MGDHYTTRKVLVAGLGKTGLSCARFLARHGIDFTVADSRSTPPGLAELRREMPDKEVRLGEFDPALFVGASRVVLSPGLPLDLPAVRAAREAGVPIMGDIELFARHAKAPVVAITGSNGKSTTTVLVGEMAKRAGKEVRVGGNLGTPALDLLAEGRPELFVLELSSFQLEVTESLDCIAATVLNISDDHLDRHHDLLEYASVKQRIFRGSGTMVLNRDDSRVTAMAQAGRKIVRFGLGVPSSQEDYGVAVLQGVEWIVRGDRPLMRAGDLRIAGRHNLANALAALALGEVAGFPWDSMIETLRTFPGLPHRCQFVAEVEGVGYYNDSKGTNVGSTLAALAGMPGEKVVLIAGGEGKGQDFTPIRDAAAAHARAVVLIGRDADIIARALGNAAPMVRTGSMEQAVREARLLARPGDTVLLSPACASFDMFNDYVHRGEMFAAAVRKLS